MTLTSFYQLLMAMGFSCTCNPSSGLLRMLIQETYSTQEGDLPLHTKKCSLNVLNHLNVYRLSAMECMCMYEYLI
jgi:hypothetical protein